MTCVSIVSELIIVGALIVLGFFFYGASDDSKPKETHRQPKSN